MQCGLRMPVAGAPRLQAAQPKGRAFTVAVDCKVLTRQEKRSAVHARIRRKLSGTPERPRLAVFRSNEHIYAQVIDDTQGVTLAAASSVTKDLKEAATEKSPSELAEAVGKKIAELCAAKNITKVAFDRGGNVYMGRVKAVAEGARAGGLAF